MRFGYKIVDHGVSGLIVDNIDDAVDAVKRLCEFDRARVRARFEARFTAERMASDYVEIYRSLAGSRGEDSGIPDVMEPEQVSAFAQTC